MLQYLGRHHTRTALRMPLYLARIPAGFPSPADDYMDKRLDLNEYLIQHQAATFYCRVTGRSMEGVGIFDGDLLIGDRAVEPRDGHIVVANTEGEITCKILDVSQRRLLSANDQFPPIMIEEDVDVCIEGVVIHSIRSHVCFE